MRRLRKFFALSAPDRRLLFQGVAATAWATLAVRLLPARRLRRMLLSSPAMVRGAPQQRFAAERIAWAIAVASRYLRGATCLPQALAAKWLLQRAGLPAQVHFGVIKQEQQLQAHAWVESQGRVLVGSPTEQYRPLPYSHDAITEGHDPLV